MEAAPVADLNKLKQPRIGNEKKLTGLWERGMKPMHMRYKCLPHWNTAAVVLLFGATAFFKAGNYTAGGSYRSVFQYAKWNGGLAAKYRMGNITFMLIIWDETGYWLSGPADGCLFAKAKMLRCLTCISRMWSIHSWKRSCILRLIMQWIPNPQGRFHPYGYAR